MLTHAPELKCRHFALIYKIALFLRSLQCCLLIGQCTWFRMHLNAQGALEMKSDKCLILMHCKAFDYAFRIIHLVQNMSSMDKGKWGIIRKLNLSHHYIKDNDLREKVVT